MSDPNTWATATVENGMGSQISRVELRHRYDTDHYDHGKWPVIDNGAKGEPVFSVGYWTGAFRTGYDYWWITFEEGGNTWVCKENFYCYLKEADAGGTVICKVYKSGSSAKMDVICPKSSSCTVSLQRI